MTSLHRGRTRRTCQSGYSFGGGHHDVGRGGRPGILFDTIEQHLLDLKNRPENFAT